MKTPLKKGIGSYALGKKFQLRSGNKPSGFKMMGSSPYKQEVENTKTEEQLAAEALVTKNDASGIAENLNAPKVNKWKTAAGKVGNTLVGAFTGGLDAVYGSGKVIPGNSVKFSDPKKDKKVCKDKDGNVVACDSPNAV